MRRPKTQMMKKILYQKSINSCVKLNMKTMAFYEPNHIRLFFHYLTHNSQ